MGKQKIRDDVYGPKRKLLMNSYHQKQLLILLTRICIKNNNISAEGHELKLLNEFDNI